MVGRKGEGCGGAQVAYATMTMRAVGSRKLLGLPVHAQQEEREGGKREATGPH